MDTPSIVVILGSAPDIVTCRDRPKPPSSTIVAINNAWRVRDDWDFHIAPEDFPHDRRPENPQPTQKMIGPDRYVRANNQYGGIVYAGGTMAFTAGYWALAELRPAILAFAGCNMVYPKSRRTHFYGSGTPDPLREDISLRNLEAKSARLMSHAARQGCACVRLRSDESRLVFPPVDWDDLTSDEITPTRPDAREFDRVMAHERDLGYFVESGRYWENAGAFSVEAIDRLDDMWLGLIGIGSLPPRKTRASGAKATPRYGTRTHG